MPDEAEMRALEPLFTPRVREAAAATWAAQTGCDPARFGELSRWTRFVFLRGALRALAS